MENKKKQYQKIQNTAEKSAKEKSLKDSIDFSESKCINKVYLSSLSPAYIWKTYYKNWFYGEEINF